MAWRTPAGRRPRWWVEAAVLVWLLWAYDATANLAHLRQAAAVAHARSVVHLEAVLHLDPELAMDRWLAGHPLLGWWVSTFYDNAHFVVTLGVLGWLWWRHPGPYRPLRTALAGLNVVALAVFWWWPMAPPRLVPGYGAVDVVAATGAPGSWHAGTLAHHANELAAMPSLHLAWAVWSAWALWQVWRSGAAGGRARRWAPVVWAYPASVAVGVLATGNHFVADVAAGVVLAAAVVPAADRVHRWLGRLAGPVPAPLAPGAADPRPGEPEVVAA